MKRRAHKKMKDKPRFISPFRLKFLFFFLACGIIFYGAVPTDAMAEVEVTFLYNLSNFDGLIPYNWANIFVDEVNQETYVVDTRERDVTVFNEYGMEVYRFGDDGSLGTVIDVAVKADGNILVFSKVGSRPSIKLCNFRGEAISELELSNFPAAFSNFSPDRMVYRKGMLYLLDSGSLRIAITDSSGLFQNGYDLGSLLGITDGRKRAATDAGGFNVDHEGNMLFTIPVLFKAYKLSPDGRLLEFGAPGSAPGKFNIVAGIAADDNYYYVADRLKSAVLIFDHDFQFKKEFGYRGIRPENLIGPKNLALDGNGRLYVSQVRSRGVSVFQIKDKPKTEEP